MTEIDNTFKAEGTAMRRFYLNRLKDETGISRTGRVLEGVLLQSGKVFVEWRPPHSTMGIYNSFEEFKIIHVDCHPSCNEVVWLDNEPCQHKKAESLSKQIVYVAPEMWTTLSAKGIYEIMGAEIWVDPEMTDRLAHFMQPDGTCAKYSV